MLLINDVETIVARHGDAKKALEDIEGRYALLMCCMQIGETLSKLESDDLKSSLPVKFAYSMRNIIAHDYLGINSKIIETTINCDLSELKANLSLILGS